MTVKPATSTDAVLAYIASDYSGKNANSLAIAVREGKFVHYFNNGEGSGCMMGVMFDWGTGFVEMEVDESIEPGKTYKVELRRQGTKTEMRVNGKKEKSKARLEPFQVGTELFMGGLAPGITPTMHLLNTSSFRGCIVKANALCP